MSPSTKTPPSPTTNDTLPTDLLLSYLHTTNHLDTLHATLLDTLSRTGWTTRVRGLAVELIRSKKVTRFEDVVDTIVGLAGEKGSGMENGVSGGKKRKAGDEHAEAVQVNGTTNKKLKTGGKGGKAKDTSRSNGVKSSSSPGSSSSGSTSEFDVRIPSAVVSQGAKYLRDTLDDLVTFGPDSEDAGEEDDQKELTNGKRK